ncbi:TPA: YSIRK-type signal peptide-containing protein, partial [Streptococcus pneumoniae]|nr:YSIRK-type signal peptide-containing protein [Streptococcus pneumoniae]
NNENWSTNYALWHKKLSIGVVSVVVGFDF